MELIERDSTISRFNATTFGNRSRYDLLPWEDAGAYAELMEIMVEHHAPQGPTETHLVQELANVMWRKQRLRLSEAAFYRRAMNHKVGDYDRGKSVVKNALMGDDAGDGWAFGGLKEALGSPPTLEKITEARKKAQRLRKTVENLRNGGSYQSGLKALGEDGREYEKEWLGEEWEYDQGSLPVTFGKDAQSLAIFIEREILPDYTKVEIVARHWAEVSDQLKGETAPIEKMEQLSRYETALDRKFERTLAMLVKLQEIRRGP